MPDLCPSPPQPKPSAPSAFPTLVNGSSNGSTEAWEPSLIPHTPHPTQLLALTTLPPASLPRPSTHAHGHGPPSSNPPPLSPGPLRCLLPSLPHSTPHSPFSALQPEGTLQADKSDHPLSCLRPFSKCTRTTFPTLDVAHNLEALVPSALSISSPAYLQLL